MKTRKIPWDMRSRHYRLRTVQNLLVNLERREKDALSELALIAKCLRFYRKLEGDISKEKE